MHDHRIVELLTRKIAGEATPDELGELSYLLKKYPDSIYYEELLEQVWALPQGENQTDTAFKKHKLKFVNDLDFEVPRKTVSDHFKKYAFAFATIAFLIFSASLYFFKVYYSTGNEVRVDIFAGKGIRKEIVLPDGTQVRLNSDSKLSYDLDMQTHDQRDVTITGEAFFIVAHDSERPFVVKTNRVAIKVLGTEFNVRDYPGDRESETTLIKGSIELTVKGRSGQKFVLKPAEKFAIVENKEKLADKSNSVLMIENVSPVKLGEQEYIEETSWTENKLVFQNESLEDLIPKLERWYNVRIILNDPTIKSYRFTGIFINENITQALEAMQLIKSFNYKLTENEVTIY